MSCLIPAEGRSGNFSGWASCLHTLGVPQQGAAAQILLAKTRQLMAACDDPHPGSCTALRRGEAAGTRRFSIPLAGMEAAVTPIPLGCAKELCTARCHRTLAPGQLSPSGHAREGWQTHGSFPRLMGVQELREGPCGSSAIWTNPCPVRIGGGYSTAGTPNSIGHGESCWQQQPAPISRGKLTRFISKGVWEILHKAKAF